jgi:transcriptional regulator with XRE-family HTH domain
MKFSLNLKKARQQKGWSQLDLAKAICLSQSAISQFENGSRLPTHSIVLKLAKLLNTNADYLIGDDELATDKIRLIRKIQLLSKDNLITFENIVNLITKLDVDSIESRISTLEQKLKLTNPISSLTKSSNKWQLSIGNNHTEIILSIKLFNGSTIEETITNAEKELQSINKEIQ